MLFRFAKFIGRQRWLVRALRIKIIARLVGDHQRIASQEFNADFFGLRFEGNLTSFIDWRVFFLGSYETITLNLFRELLSRMDQPVALDVGANAGNHTLFMSLYCSEVHAFEPYPRVARQLKRNVEINGLDKVRLHEVGLSDQDQRLPYFENADRNFGAGSFESGHQGLQDSAKCDLPLVAGDAYLQGLGLKRLDFMKIDIEGFEVEALRGMRGTLEKFRPVMVVELGPTTLTKVGSLQQFEALFPSDYHLYRVARVGFFRSEEPRVTEMVVRKKIYNVLAIPREKRHIARGLGARD